MTSIPSFRRRRPRPEVDWLESLDTVDLGANQHILDNLPRLTEADFTPAELGYFCIICYNTYKAILAEEEMAIAMDSPAIPVEDLGVTKLAAEWQCKHPFCRKCITKWIRSGRTTCPMCRTSMIQGGQRGTETLPEYRDSVNIPSMEELEGLFSGDIPGWLLRGEAPPPTTNDIETAPPSGMYS